VVTGGRDHAVDPIPLARNPISESTIRRADRWTRTRFNRSLDQSNRKSHVHPRAASAKADTLPLPFREDIPVSREKPEPPGSREVVQFASEQAVNPSTSVDLHRTTFVNPAGLSSRLGRRRQPKLTTRPASGSGSVPRNSDQTGRPQKTGLLRETRPSASGRGGKLSGLPDRDIRKTCDLRTGSGDDTGTSDSGILVSVGVCRRQVARWDH
jgi:hypothetical protein